MTFVKRGLIASVAAAGIVVGSAGLASADDSSHEGDNTNLENNSLIEDVLGDNTVEDNLNGNGNIGDNLNGNEVLNGNDVVIDDVLGGGLLD